MRINSIDAAVGVIFILIGAFFAVFALRYLPLGTSNRMGPGYFPAMVGALLVFFGLIVIVRAFVTPDTDFGAVPWRGIALIGLAPIVFGICIRGLGMGPTVALTTFISAIASHKVGMVKAVALSIGMTIFCVALFTKALGLPIPILGPWLGGV